MADDPRVVIVASRRWEPQHLVDDFIANHKWADQVIIFDDSGRADDDLWCDEAERYRELHRLAGEAGADWVIGTAPDERFDIRAEKVIREATRRQVGKADVYFRFKVLELFSPNKYRVDGQWAKHSQQRMYPWREDQTFKPGKLHHAIVPDRKKMIMVKQLPINIYHLKHIERENWKKRVDMFKLIDPGEKDCNHEGYEYLDDEKNMKLEEIRWGHGYKPPYTTPYLWEPPILDKQTNAY